METKKTKLTSNINCLDIDRVKELILQMEKSTDTLEDAVKTQCSDGNWNYDPYMHGMANGMIFALSLFKGDKPEYLEAPAKWGKDNPDLSKPTVATQF
jgi:hypothetical protein